MNRLPIRAITISIFALISKPTHAAEPFRLSVEKVRPPIEEGFQIGHQRDENGLYVDYVTMPGNYYPVKVTGKTPQDVERTVEQLFQPQRGDNQNRNNNANNDKRLGTALVGSGLALVTFGALKLYKSG